MVKLIIDKKQVEVEAGTSILEAAKKCGVEIPTLCYLKDINEIGACRICLVEVEGLDRLVSACNTPAEEGMVVKTHTPKVQASRRVNLQLILSQHDCSCPTCIRSGNCTLQTLSNTLAIKANAFQTKTTCNGWNMKSPLIRQESKCIKCMRCIQVCDKVQGMGIWDIKGSGNHTSVGLSDAYDILNSDCTFCGQCVTHCPTGALTALDQTSRVVEAIADPDKITVVQIAPAVRAAWGEAFGLTKEEASVERIAACLKEIGIDYVFDTNFSADLTIMEEGNEFIERFKNKEKYSWPMFTSCCPGWVRFVKGQYPHLVPNLSTAKSPQQMFGAIAKSYFAERIDVDPHNIFVISIMPCIAKKQESNLSTMNDACGDPDVDIVLTTRELTRLIKSEFVNPKSVQPVPLDNPLGTGTGAAVIFGATGGVMDAALRTAYYSITGTNPDPDAFKAVRGIEGWKEAVFNIPGAGDVKVAVVSGLGNTRELIRALKVGKVSYDFVEVMACPGGCAGGGGQPIHEGLECAEERGKHLWNLDSNAEIRYSHENPDVQVLYSEFLLQPLGEKSHELLHTDHTAWKMPNEK